MLGCIPVCDGSILAARERSSSVGAFYALTMRLKKSIRVTKNMA
jgi:hypothetical protein